MSAAAIDFLRNRALRIARRLHPAAGPLRELRVTVNGGAMMGLSADVDGAGLTIGGREGSDILLVDQAAGDTVVSIETRRSAVGPLVRLSSDDGGVSVAGAPVDSTGLWERLPCEVDLSGIPVTLSRPREEAAADPMTLALFGLACLTGAAVLVAPGPDPSYRVATAAQGGATQIASDGLQRLNAEMQQAGLAGHLVVAPLGDGSIEVSGALPAAKMAAWRDLRMAWDARPDLPPLMGRVEARNRLERLPPIAAIRLGAKAYLLMANGDTIRPGEILVDDWRVTEITPDGLWLARDGETIEMTY